MPGIPFHTCIHCHQGSPPLQGLWPFGWISKPTGPLRVTHAYDTINLLINTYLSLLTLIHLEADFLLCYSFGLAINLTRTLFCWQLLDRCMVLFLYLFQELLFTLIGLLVDLLTFLLTGRLLGVHLLRYFAHHLRVPFYLLLGVLAPVFYQPRLFYEVLVLL